MVRDVSLSWFRHGSSWFVMVHDVSLSWFRHGSSWFVMVRDVSLSWFHHGSSWFVMCYSLKFSRRRSCDPLFSQSGSQIHYQISFLMRLLIFPFPFKEHTSQELCYKWWIFLDFLGFHLQPLSGVWYIHLLCRQWNEFVMENGIKTQQLNKNLILKPQFSLICDSSVLRSLVATRHLKSL